MTVTIGKKQNTTTLSGSVQTVVEYLEYSVHSLLYQRGLYPSDDFQIVKKYNLSLLISNDDKVKEYISTIIKQLHHWLDTKVISKVVMVISNRETGQILERWSFDIKILETSGAQAPKSEKETQSEIAAVLRQITASVSFLPVLEDPCTFNILAYTEHNAEVPPTWIDSDPKMIEKKAEQVRLKSFSTSVHKVDSLVAYAVDP